MGEKDFAKIFSEWEQQNKIINKDKGKNNTTNYHDEKCNGKKCKENILTIDLHGLTRERAIRNLRKFVLQNRSKKIQIIHGAGIHSQGGRPILKAVVREWLTGHPGLIRSFRPASIGEGRFGATIAYLY